MCFSAHASFIAAALLLCIGILCARLVKSRSQALLAAIPFFFAAQQTAEGFLWILIPRGGPPKTIYLATGIFLIFAFIVYPIWLPLSVRALETDRTRRSIISGCFFLGVFWALGAAFFLSTSEFHAITKGCHIYYAFHKVHFPYGLALILYASTTILPFFIARWWALKVFGLAIGLSCVAALLLWHTYFISVWCFFAAILSMGVYAIIAALNKRPGH